MTLISPMDEHNSTLVENVHPEDWNNPTPTGRYNLVVIGGGTAGLVTALGAAGLGAKVAMIERHLIGGDCLNVGCVPSKGIIASARVAKTVRTAGDFGIGVAGPVNVDFGAVMQRMRKLRAKISFNDSAERMKRDGVDMFIGNAKFTSDHKVEVAGQTLDYAKAVIATGARAVELPIEGLGDVDYLTNENLFDLTTLPRRMAIVGGGPIGVEMAQSFARFGTEVTLLERGERILSKDDPDASRIVTASLVADGVEILRHAEAKSVNQSGTGDDKEISLTIDVNGESTQRTVNALLLGVGRQPNVDGLNLEAVGVEYDARDGVNVSDYLQTTNKNIYACGDVASRFKFTHAADFMARAVIANTLFFGRSKLSALTIPRATYSDPEVAHVGLSRSEAEAAGHDVETFTQEFEDVDRAILDGETEGFVRVHAVKGKGTILGATIVAAHAGDMISEVSVAMKAGMKLSTLANVIHPYPTQAEAIRKIGDQFNKTRLKGFSKRLLNTIVKWRR